MNCGVGAAFHREITGFGDSVLHTRSWRTIWFDFNITHPTMPHANTKGMGSWVVMDNENGVHGQCPELELKLIE